MGRGMELRKGKRWGALRSCQTTESPMSQNRLPPPCAPECLDRPCPSSQKGGTLIAEEVTEEEAHQRRLCDPDGYRPSRCPRCGHDVLHVHAYRERQVPGEDERSVMRIVIHRCADQECRATWRILPLFLARRLWRTWRTVEREVLPQAAAPSRAQVPRRTVRRWKARLCSSARYLGQVLATSASALWTTVAQAVGLGGTRRALVEELAPVQGTPPGRRLAEPAALVHRLCPGVRLM